MSIKFVARCSRIYLLGSIWNLAGYKENNTFIVSITLVRRKLCLLLLAGRLNWFICWRNNNWMTYAEEGQSFWWRLLRVPSAVTGTDSRIDSLTCCAAHVNFMCDAGKQRRAAWLTKFTITAFMSPKSVVKTFYRDRNGKKGRRPWRWNIITIAETPSPGKRWPELTTHASLDRIRLSDSDRKSVGAAVWYNCEDYWESGNLRW
jgi:hypothetical protein